MPYLELIRHAMTRGNLERRWTGTTDQPLCPEGTALLSLTVEEERYVVDVSGSWLEGEEDPRRIQAIAATLAEWEPEARVELLVEGQPAES